MIFDFIFVTVIVTVLVVGMSWYIHLLRRKSLLQEMVFSPPSPTPTDGRRRIIAIGLGILLIIAVTAAITASLVGGTK